MTEHTDFTNLPQAQGEPARKRRISVVWIIPIVAAVVSIGIAVQRYLSEGPSIRITFQNAEGIEAGKTSIKYKDVDIGTVTKVNLTDNYASILVTARMEKSVEPLLDKDANFWIVKPRVTLSGVSGLGTLFSGNYIGFEPGRSKEKQRDFIGLENPPAVTRDRPGRQFVLRSDSLGSLGIGSPVYYRRFSVGDVIGYGISQDGKSVDVRIFLNAPYDRFVTPDTRFWEASGIEMSVGTGGFSVHTESLTALLAGGIAFDTPIGTRPEEATTDTVFTLFKDPKTAMAPAASEIQRFALYPEESVRGLSAGAPVLFLGLPVGEVSGITLQYDERERKLRTRVEITTYVFRFAQHYDKTTLLFRQSLSRKERLALMQRLVAEKGLRAQLRTASIVSGQLYVGVDYFPDAAPARIDWKQEPPEFPMVRGGMAELQQKIQSIVAKLDKVPVEEIGNDTRKAIATLDNTLQSASRTLDSATRMLQRVNEETLPEARKALEDLRRAIVRAEAVLSNADNTLVGPDAPTQQQLRDALKEVERAAQAVRVLADYLERNPGALIRGKSQEDP